ncbi:unnamed protein product, partial [Urochloa humidicola]
PCPSLCRRLIPPVLPSTDALTGRDDQRCVEASGSQTKRRVGPTAVSGGSGGQRRGGGLGEWTRRTRGRPRRGLRTEGEAQAARRHCGSAASTRRWCAQPATEAAPAHQLGRATGATVGVRYGLHAWQRQPRVQQRRRPATEGHVG